MPAKKDSPRATVHTTWEVFDLASVADGYALPREMTARAELADGTVVRIEVEVSGGRARARTIEVSTERPNGIGWTTLSSVPVRDIVATSCLDALHTAEPITKKGETTLKLVRLPKDADADAVRQIVQSLVGYRPNREGMVTER